MSLLFASSSSDLSLNTIKKLGIECVCEPYQKDSQICFFDENFDFQKFYSKCKKGVDIDTARLTRDEYIEIFEPCLKQGDDVVFVHSSKNICNVEELHKASEILCEKYPERKFKLIDSKNLSIGQGLVTFASALLYRKGEDIDSLVEKTYELRDEYAFFFACDSVAKLESNKLIDGTLVTGGTALNIKPIMTINLDGKIELFDKVSGKKKAISKLLDIIRQTGENVADYPIGIVYTSDKNSAEELLSKIKETFGNDTNVLLEQMTPNNTSILGHELLGLAFHVHRKMH